MRFSPSKAITISRLIIAGWFALVAIGFSQENKSSSDFAQDELDKRKLAVEEGQMLLTKGDEAYLAGNFKDAIQAYSGAVGAFPVSLTTQELRDSALERYAQASIEHGKELSRKGLIDEAKRVIDSVLAENFAPNHAGALAARAALDDPIRTNPALTAEHAKDVDEVRSLLYKAYGAYDLAKFDEAEEHFTAILRIDPYNNAARRGMERVAAQKSDYFKAAYDQARSEALLEVSRAWELPLESNIMIPPAPQETGSAAASPKVSLVNKLSRIIIPKFNVEDVDLFEAIDALRASAANNDNFELDLNRKGINIATNLGDPESSQTKQILAKRFDLRLSNVSVEYILKCITQMTRTHFKYDDFAVVITHYEAGGGSLITRSYRVPPDFLSKLSVAAPTEAEEQDVFNTAPSANESLARRMSAQEALILQGVSFPDGASAVFNPNSSTLMVVNTMNNHDIIQQIIDLTVAVEPVAIMVKMTMVKVENRVLEELGFDWMINSFNLKGAGRGALTGGTVGTGGIIDDLPLVPNNPAPLNPITAGNRSGDTAYNRFGLDELLGAGVDRGVQEVARAPGVIGVNGVVNNSTIQMLLRGLDQKKSGDVLATPAVTTRSGQVATLSAVREFLYPTEYDPPQIPQTIATGSAAPIIPSFPTSFEKRDIGHLFEVLPTVDKDRSYVDVMIKPMITDFDGYVNYGSPINSIINNQAVEIANNPILMPVFSVIRADTHVNVYDGATIVIGGMLRDSAFNVDDKTPILGDIPLLGRFFQTNGIKRISSAILIFVNVQLVDPTGKPYKSR